MPTLPSSLPVWASDSGASITVPPTVKQEAGWELTTPKEKPKLDYFNWWMNLVYQWILYLSTFLATSKNVTILNNQSSAANLGLSLDPTLFRAAKIQIALYVDATTDVQCVAEFWAISNGTTWVTSNYWLPATSTAVPGFVPSITSAGVVQYTTANYTGFASARASYSLMRLDLV